MKVVVFGASGKVGRLVVQKLLDDTYDVVAVVHKNSPFTHTTHLTIMKGDIHNLNDVRGAMQDCEVVISTLGSWGTQEKDIVSNGMANILAAMSSYGIRRVISLTGADAVAEGDPQNLMNRLFHRILSLSPARKILVDGEKHLRLLEKSQMDWTVLRSPIMNTKGDARHSILSLAKPKPWETINRQSVANAIAEQLKTMEYYKKAPFIRRKTP